MNIEILTLFPALCESVLNESIIGRAREKNLFSVNCRNIRDYTTDKHNRVDDSPYGGSGGMIMQASPIYDCFMSIVKDSGIRPHLIYMSPAGKTLTQSRAKELSKLNNIAVLCGHYEGVDERVIEEIVDEEISIGDYVLTGGELPALVLIDAIVRMIPGVLASDEAYEKESHYNSLLEYPQYTRPFSWRGKEVPAVLLSGHHANIEKWQREKSLERTLKKRPDMLGKADLTFNDNLFLNSMKNRDK
ncbi:MAG: tRNA (guanosine(37)-N1)-methyltransferase TrmD [Oscillospiraceae bacterium]|jgi:tRNA (guanine37-N1)-methyltransferase|nr:tRNA (guanosine(37)-N1)-methyltransferase TrmD [Oscillospiraceae bacterium]